MFRLFKSKKDESKKDFRDLLSEYTARQQVLGHRVTLRLPCQILSGF
jgi:hypothetical protein